MNIKENLHKSYAMSVSLVTIAVHKTHKLSAHPSCNAVLHKAHSVIVD